MCKGACTCDPEAYDLGPEGQRRYFPDRYCPVHGEQPKGASSDLEIASAIAAGEALDEEAEREQMGASTS